MWGPGGSTYVYLCYGLHNMLNLVADQEGFGAAVLIRACEPVAGLAVIRERRGGKHGPVLLTGPGKVGAALGLDTSWSEHAVYEPGGLEVWDAPAVEHCLAGPRVGIDYADPADVVAPWRLAVPGTRWVSHPRGLAPSTPPFCAPTR
jgi:DNA-3-methyladenine glycosylase